MVKHLGVFFMLPTGEGTDACHPRVLLVLSVERYQKVADFELAEVRGKWPATDRVLAPLSTQIRWRRWVRGSTT